MALVIAGAILLGTRAYLSGADESKVTEKATAKSQKEVDRLIDCLGSKQFKDREQATHELWKRGESALPSLKEATNSPDAEVRRRAHQLVERLEPPPARSIDPQLGKSRPAAKCYL